MTEPSASRVTGIRRDIGTAPGGLPKLTPAS